MTDTPDGTIPYMVDAIIFNPDNTVTIQFADPERASRNPRILTGETMTVPFDYDSNIVTVVTSVLEAACDLIAYAKEAQRAPAARIPGR